jgi:uncharacterized protein YqeY
MTIKERINADFIKAFKEKDFARKDFLGLLKSEIQNEETRPNAVSSDANTLLILRRMEKTLKQTDSPESLVELQYMEPYLPQLMSEDQIREIVNGYKANGLNNAGQIMGQFNKEHKGLADNRVVSEIVKEVLA